ncbi:MAG: PH domain-containing protein [Candidatus Taylorbacteria bacterium]
MVPLDQEQHLGKKAFLLLLLQRTIFVFVLIILAIMITVFRDLITTSFISSGDLLGQGGLSSITLNSISSIMIIGLFLLSGLLFIVGLIISYLQYHFYTYSFGEFSLKLIRGILHREEVSIPYRQMQDINIDRPLVYRILGVSRVVIDSAGHEEFGESRSETDIVLEPIDEKLAREIRDMLQRRIGVQIVEDEKEADLEIMSGKYEE